MNNQLKSSSLIIALALALFTGNVSAQLTILSVSPDSAEPGTTGQTVTFTLPDTTPPSPPVSVQPTSVMIGTMSGTSISRPSLETVTAVFDIPVDEPEGTKDCSIIFAGPTFTIADGFTVGDGSSGGGGSSYTNGPPASGYNLFNPMTSKTAYLMDNDENIVKSWTSSYNIGLSLYLLDDGTLLRTANTGSADFDEGGTAGRVELFDWDGSMAWSYDYDTTSYRTHHDVEMLPNGNVLMIAWELKTQAEAEAAGRNPALISEGELWPDHIIEVQPNGTSGGTIVWEWHVWDHMIQDYDAAKPNYGVVADHPEKVDLNYTQSGPNAGIADWNHFNSIDYNEELDQILVSVHNFSEIWVIDHNTTTTEAADSAGDLLYRWGNPAAYDSGSSADQQLFVQHDAKWIEEGLVGEDNILIFNNGQGRSDGDYSSVVEIVPPVAGDGSYTLGLPAAPTWIYTAATPTDFYASRISGAQRLKNGNTLICEGTEKYAFEVNSDGGLVWDYTDAAEMFRFDRYAPNFPGFDDTELALFVVYVDEDNGAGPWDGASWASAYTTVQAGIDAASAEGGGDVWVAEGTYRPTTDSDRTASFTMAADVNLYGGFNGTESDMDQRDPSVSASILSGDIGVSGMDTDNSYHVIVGASDATLDGFIIRDGQADGARQNQHGGGLYCVDEISPTVIQCIFTENYAGEGAGVYAYNASSSDFTDCEFSANTANRGGALLLRNGCSGAFSGCSFVSNVAVWAGGAIYADYGSSPTFTDCTFSTNSTTGKGGAFFTDDLASQVGISSPVFVDCSFTGNSATYRGGGVYNFDGSETSVSDSTFTGNSAGIGGGAIANDLNSELTLSGVTYSGNYSTTGEADVDSDSTSVVY